MQNLVLQPTEKAQWHSLIQEAEHACHIQLGEELQSYLVFLLMRYTQAPQLAESVLAVEYLTSLEVSGKLGEVKLSEVGDKCLLYSGLFPQRAEQKRVRISYFVHLGESAYSVLANSLATVRAAIYANLSAHFVVLMDILQTTRELSENATTLQPLQAIELWNDTGSPRARAVLARYTTATPVFVTASESSHSLRRQNTRFN